MDMDAAEAAFGKLGMAAEAAIEGVGVALDSIPVVGEVFLAIQVCMYMSYLTGTLLPMSHPSVIRSTLYHNLNESRGVWNVQGIYFAVRDVVKIITNAVYAKLVLIIAPSYSDVN